MVVLDGGDMCSGGGHMWSGGGDMCLDGGDMCSGFGGGRGLEVLQDRSVWYPGVCVCTHLRGHHAEGQAGTETW